MNTDEEQTRGGVRKQHAFLACSSQLAAWSFRSRRVSRGRRGEAAERKRQSRSVLGRVPGVPVALVVASVPAAPGRRPRHAPCAHPSSYGLRMTHYLPDLVLDLDLRSGLETTDESAGRRICDTRMKRRSLTQRQQREQRKGRREEEPEPGFGHGRHSWLVACSLRLPMHFVLRVSQGRRPRALELRAWPTRPRPELDHRPRPQHPGRRLTATATPPARPSSSPPPPPP